MQNLNNFSYSIDVLVVIICIGEIVMKIICEIVMKIIFTWSFYIFLKWLLEF